MKSALFQNLDSLVWSAADVQKQIPIESARLQTLMKRHFPKSEGVQPETGVARRSYTGRMIIWLALTNKLMSMGLSIRTASEMSSFSFYGGMDKEYKILADGENSEEITKISRLVAIAYPANDSEDNPEFGITDLEYAPKFGTFISLYLGEFLLNLSASFESRTMSPTEKERASVKWL